MRRLRLGEEEGRLIVYFFSEEAWVGVLHGRLFGCRGVLHSSHCEARARGPALHWIMRRQAPAVAGGRGRSQRQHQKLHVLVLCPDTHVREKLGVRVRLLGHTLRGLGCATKTPEMAFSGDTSGYSHDLRREQSLVDVQERSRRFCRQLRNVYV